MPTPTQTRKLKAQAAADSIHRLTRELIDAMNDALDQGLYLQPPEWEATDSGRLQLVSGPHVATLLVPTDDLKDPPPET